MRNFTFMRRFQLLFILVIIDAYRNLPFGGAFFTKFSHFQRHDIAIDPTCLSKLSYLKTLGLEYLGSRPFQLKAVFDSTELADGAVQHVVDQPKTVKTLTPYQEAVKKYQYQLEKELEFVESVLLCEENLLKFRIDTLSVSGKSGFVYVQTEVAQFLKKKENEQKDRVVKNKLEFVQKMLPVVDAFRAAPSVAPPSTEREGSIHQNFGSLCQSILLVFEKNGYKEYDAGNCIDYLIAGTDMCDKHLTPMENCTDSVPVTQFAILLSTI